MREVEELRRLGANEIVPEEFETALEIFDRVLTQYLVPRPEIDHLVEEMRSGNYDLLRQEALPETTEVSQEPNLHPEIQVTTLLLDAACSWNGQSLQENPSSCRAWSEPGSPSPTGENAAGFVGRNNPSSR